MTIFISYSHTNKEFVDQLAAHMVKKNAQVWVDTWELNVGDSIIQRVQDAITEADALLVVLSNASVKSEWCKKELNSGLIRELEERRVVVLPVVIDDCDIPLFLREKMYADFRGDFDQGLDAVMDAIAKVSNPNQGRLNDENGYSDWAIDWGDVDGLFHLRFTIIQTALNMNLTFLTEIYVFCNDVLTKRQQQFIDAGLGWLGRMVVAEALFEFGDTKDLKMILDSQFPQTVKAKIRDSKRRTEYEVIATCRKLGQDNGKDQLVNISNYLKGVRAYLRATSRKPNKEEQQKFIEIVKSPLPE